MSNKQSSVVDWIFLQLPDEYTTTRSGFDVYQKAKAMQQEQALLYASFVLKCVQNNLPPITFNDWINLDNNEQQ